MENLFSQLILISRLNVQLGLPDVAFAIGDDAILEVSRELLAMPMMVMMAALCPSRDLTLFEPWTHPSAGPRSPFACSMLCQAPPPPSSRSLQACRWRARPSRARSLLG